MFYQIPALKNFAKLTRNHLCRSLLLNKVAGLRSAVLLKKRLRQWCFPVNFVNFLRTTFFIEHLQWLILERMYLPMNIFKQLNFTNGNFRKVQQFYL